MGLHENRPVVFTSIGFVTSLTLACRYAIQPFSLPSAVLFAQHKYRATLSVHKIELIIEMEQAPLRSMHHVFLLE